MSVIDFETRLLRSLDVVPNEATGILMYQPEGEKPSELKVTVQRGDTKEALPLVLPTPEVQREEEDFTKLKFHPFSESVMTKESEVQNILLILGSGKLCELGFKIASQLVNIAVTIGNGDKMSNRAAKIINKLPGIKSQKSQEKAVRYMQRVINASTAIKGEHPFLRLNLSRRKRDDVEDSLRWCALNVDIFEHMDGESIYGIKAPSKAAYDLVRAAFALTFGIDPTTEFSGSQELFFNATKSNTAPSYEVFLRTLRDVMKHYHSVQYALGAIADKNIDIQTDWFDMVESFEDLSQEIPVTYEGNIGLPTKGGVEVKASASSKPKPSFNKPNVTVSPSKPVQESAPVEPVAQPEESKPMNEEVKVETPRLSLGSVIRSGVSSYNHAQKTNTAKPTVTAARPQAVTPPKPTSRPQVTSRPTNPSSHTHTGGVKLSRPPEREVQLIDSLNEPVFYRNGQPYMVKESDFPRGYFIIGRNPSGYPDYNENGEPVLWEITRDELNDMYRQGAGRQGVDPRYSRGYPQDRGPVIGNQQVDFYGHTYRDAPRGGYPDRGRYDQRPPQDSYYGPNGGGAPYRAQPQGGRYQQDYNTPAPAMPYNSYVK